MASGGCASLGALCASLGALSSAASCYSSSVHLVHRPACPLQEWGQLLRRGPLGVVDLEVLSCVEFLHRVPHRKCDPLLGARRRLGDAPLDHLQPSHLPLHTTASSSYSSRASRSSSSK